MIDLKIHTPQWGAGTTYRWEKEFGIRGIGISSKRINFWKNIGKEHLKIKVGDVEYKARLSRFMKFFRNHPASRCYAKHTLLYCFPISLMEVTNIKKLEPVVEPQLSLFS